MDRKKLKLNIEKFMTKALSTCKMWEDSTDGSYGMCLHMNKYNKAQRILKKLNETKLQRVIEN